MAIYKSRYVDPETCSWVLTSWHNWQRIDAELGWVYGMLTTLRGSIPELPWFGSNLRRMTHLVPGVTRQIEGAVDEALRPFVGKRFSQYTRRAQFQNGAPLLTVTITVEGRTGQLEIPLAVE